MNDENGGDTMNMIPPKGRMEWNFNTLVTIGGLMAVFAGNAFALGVIYNTMTNNDADNARKIADLQTAFNGNRAEYAERRKSTDTNFRAIFDKMPQFDLINQQLLRVTEIQGAQAKAVEETNKRLDRIVESQNGKLDTIIKSVADLTTEIRVVQSQIKDQDERVQRTRFLPRPSS